MTIVQAAVLGAVQGLTEFLPISSSGHLLVVPALFGWPAQGMTFDVGVHLATLLAIVIAMRREIGLIVTGVRAGSAASRALLAKLLVGTVPAVLAGFFLADWLESIRTVTVAAWMLMVWGVLLAVADRRGKRKTDSGKTTVQDVTWGQAMLVGVAQAFALVPGTSRAGATITAGLFGGLERAQAARYTFLLAIPAILAAGAKTAFDALQMGWSIEGVPFAVGFVCALVSGIFAIRFLLAILQRGGFLGFAVYRVAFGLAILLFIAEHAVTRS